MHVEGSGVTRRGFLASLGWSATGVTLVSCRLLPVLPTQRTPSKHDAIGWLQVRTDGTVELRSPVAEFGQGATTGLAQIVAEELGVSPDTVVVALPDTGTHSVVRATVGSRSIASHARLVAEMAAALREVLRARVADRAGARVDEVEDATDGGFVLRGGARASLADAAAGEPVVVDADALAATPTRTFDGAQARWVGRDVVPAELRAIVTGGAMFSADVRLPDTAYGALLRPPVPGAELEDAALDAARRVDGYVAGIVDRSRGIAGVVADDPFRLRAVIAAAHATWRSPPPFEQEDLDRELDVDGRLARGPLQHVLAADRVGSGPWDVDVRVDTPLVAHAAIEPRAAVARWTGGRCEIWVGTQDAFFNRDWLARALRVAPGDVVIHGQRMGGAFGGRFGSEGFEAAILARAARRPVKVQWSRPDEFQHAYHGPPTSHRIRARLGGDGRIVAWWHAATSGHVLLLSAGLPPWLQAATALILDEGTSRGLMPPYHVGRRRIEITDVRLPIATGPWRGLGAAPNAFAIETAMDALAAAASVDPLEFRIRHLGSRDAPLARCLERVAASAGWKGPGGPGRGVAVASATYKEHSHVAVVAEVSAAGGALSVARVVCAHRCGRVVNPDRVRAQIEGNVVWAIGYALRHRLAVADGRVAAEYFTQFPLPTIADMPRLVIDLVDADDGVAPIGGAGEPAVTAATAAIAAAAAQALGVRPRALPVQAGDAS